MMHQYSLLFTHKLNNKHIMIFFSRSCFVIAVLLAPLLFLEVAVHGACDVCANNADGDFNPSNTIREDGGVSTCGDFIEDYDLTSLEQDSSICNSLAVASSMFCCGEGSGNVPDTIPCLDEITAMGECLFPTTEEECCLGPETKAPSPVLDPKADTDICDLIPKKEIEDTADDFKECCSICADEISAWGKCLQQNCGKSSSPTKNLKQRKQFLSLSFLVPAFLGMFM